MMEECCSCSTIHKNDKPSIYDNEPIIIYIYFTSEAFNVSAELYVKIHNAIGDIFNIREPMIFVDITDSADEFDQVLHKYYETNPIIILTESSSKNVIRAIEGISSDIDFSKLFLIASTSSAQDPLLLKDNIMRFLQLDSLYTIQSYTQLIDQIEADNIVLLVDEFDVWAANVASLIQEHYAPKQLLRMPLETTSVLPEGTMNIVALSTTPYPRLFDVLGPRKYDVKGVLLGDGSNRSTLQNQEQLDLMTLWDSKTLIPMHYMKNDRIENAIVDIAGPETRALNGTIMTLGYQVACYLKNNVYPASEYKKQKSLMGLTFDTKYPSVDTHVFFAMGFTQVGGICDQIKQIITVL